MKLVAWAIFFAIASFVFPYRVAFADDAAAPVAAAPSPSPSPSPSVQPIAFPARIDEIQIEGLIRTKPFVVRRELGFAEGDVITKADLDLAITRLWNTTIFAHVDADISRRVSDGKVVATFRLEDRWTLNPLFRFGSGGGAIYFRVGAADNNIAGRFLEAQAQYENFDGFHGGQIILHDPRIFNQRAELFIQVDRLVRPRQGFSDQRSQAIVELAKYYDQDRFRIDLRASGFINRFLKPLEGNGPPFYPAPTETFLVEPALRVGRVDLVRLRYTGASFELRPGMGFTTSDVASNFATMTAEALAFAMVGTRWNFAFRLHAADISRVAPHLELWAGGLDLLRGFPDNYVRTRAFALTNIEARFTAFDSTWVALVPTAFVDAIAARSPSGPVGEAISIGAGIRLLVPKFVGTGLRADLAIPIGSNLRGVTEAEQSRLGPVTPSVNLGSVQPSFGVYQFF